MSLLVALTLLEVGFRGIRYVVRGPSSRPTVHDAELGWVHNVKRPVVTRKNSCGQDVVTQPAPSPHLVRRPLDGSGTRLLFLGDSSTHAHEVSTGAAYYDVVDAIGHGRYAVWAAGAGGYGNLQEYLLLEKIYEEIQPEVVIWQLDANDVNDNVYRLDSAVLNNNAQPRPYLDPVSGDIEFRNPALRLLRISQGARFVLSRLMVLDEKYALDLREHVESWLGPAAQEVPRLTRRGLQVLDAVLTKAMQRPEYALRRILHECGQRRGLRRHLPPPRRAVLAWCVGPRQHRRHTHGLLPVGPALEPRRQPRRGNDPGGAAVRNVAASRRVGALSCCA